MPEPGVIAFALLCLVLLWAAWSDVRTGRVPNWLTLGSIALGLAHWSIALGQRGAVASALAMAAGLVPLALIFAMGGLGGGDVKLMGAVGALSADWRVVLGCAVYAFLIAALWAVVLMLRNRIVKQTFARIFGAMLFLLARAKPDLTTQSPRIPFAAALCVGGILAGLERLLKISLPWGEILR